MKPARRAAHNGNTALRAVLFALALCAAAPALGQTCTFNANQPNSVSFGTIDPRLVTPATFAITINYKCTGSANATFNLAGQNDTGPGLYRLKHTTQVPSQYMNYSVSLANVPGTKVTLNGLLVFTDYQNAYAGNYSDSLTLSIFP
jgi:hypothetical protein